MDDSEEIRQRLTDDLEHLLDTYYPGWLKIRSKAYPLPNNGKKDPGSFEVHLAGPKRGRWFRNSAGIGGDVINLISYAATGHHQRYAEAFQEAKRFLGLEGGMDRQEARQRTDTARREAIERHRHEQEMDERERIEFARRIWMETSAIIGTLAEIYLHSRRLEMDAYPPSLRFHPSLWHSASGMMFPCLVAGLQKVNGEFAGIWRIYLAPDGSGKAPVRRPKVGLGVASGAAVRLAPAGEHLGVGEGLESSMSAYLMNDGRIPVWAGLSTSGVAGMELPLDVERLTIFSDGDRARLSPQGRVMDPAGQSAAMRLCDRVRHEGITVDIQYPMPTATGGRDYNDVWMRLRKIHDQAVERSDR